MASVQAPNHILLPDLLHRIRCLDQAPLADGLQYSSSLLHKPHHGGAMQQQLQLQQQQQQRQQQSLNVYDGMDHKRMLTLHDPSTNIAAERFNLNITSNNNTTNNSKNKRLRTLEHPSCDQEEIQASMRIMPSSFFFAEPRSMSKHTFAPGKPPIASTGIHMSAADVKTDMPRASLISPNSHPPSLAFAQTPDTPFSRHLQTRLAQQAGEICRLVDSQAERIKEALEEATLVRTRSLALTIEESVSKRLKAKDGELELASLKSAQLEGRLKQLTLEVQLWRNVAKNNELMAMNLRQSLEQVMVQARNQQQKNHHHQQYHQHHQHHHQWNAATREEGCGESSEVDDAECFRIVGNLHADELQMTTRKCKVCKGNEVCMLLLPCRHLCLCRDCEREMDACPSCGTTKNASVQVYMS